MLQIFEHVSVFSLSGVYAMEWREARARSCSLLEEAMGGSCGLLRKARGEVSLVWGEARCLMLIMRAAGYQEFEGCLRVPALGMF